MKLQELPSAVKETLAAHEAFRRLGFKADDIFVMYAQPEVLVVLKAQNQEFSVSAGQLDTVSEEEFPELWGNAATLFNTAPIDQAIEIWDNSNSRKMILTIASALKSKGFFIPCLVN